MRFVPLFSGIVAAGVLFSCAAGALGQEEDSAYSQQRMEAGKAAYAARRYADAVEDFRVASFGFLDDPVRLSESLARLAVAEDVAGSPAARDETLAKFVELESRFPSYVNAPIEPDVRVTLERLLRAHVPASKLQEVPSLAGVENGSRRTAPQSTGAPPPAPPAPTAVPRPVFPTVTSTSPPPPRTATAIPRPTATLAPPTPVPPRPTGTSSPIPPTRTWTPNRIPPTRTSTPTPTPTPTPTQTPTPTRVPYTFTPLPPTRTPSPVPPTRTASPFPTRTWTPVPPTPTRTAVPTPRPTRTLPPPPPTRTAVAPPTIPATAVAAPTRVAAARIVPIEAVDRVPRPLRTVQPVYPPDALRRRLRGLVILRVLVSETGVPVEVVAVQGAPGGLTEAAERAVVQWQFEPALVGGRPVRTWATIRIPFEAIPFATPTPVGGTGDERPPDVPPRAPTKPPPVSPSRVPFPTATPAPARIADRAAPSPSSPERPSLTAAPVPPEPPSGERAPEARIYRTRGGILLTLAPQQARVSLDGRYIGIADDWDGRGGGLVLRIAQPGPHRLRLELPGYRPFEAEIDVSPNAGEETVDLGDDLERLSRTPYARLAQPIASTRRYLALLIDPPDAVVSVDGGRPIPAAAVSSNDPLELPPGPAVHDITLTAPGRALRTIRVICAPNAPAEVTTVRVSLNAR